MLSLTQTTGVQQQQRQSQTMQLSLRAQQRLEFLSLQVQALSTTLRLRAEQNPFLEYEPPLNQPASGNFHEAGARDMLYEKTTDYLLSGHEGYGKHLDDAEQKDAVRRHDHKILSLTEPETLYRHLEKQVLENYSPGAERELLLLICDALDRHGYLRILPRDLQMEWWSLHHGHPEHAEERDIIDAIKKVQQLDPPGVGARSLSECLELQVRADPISSPERTLRLKLCQRLGDLLKYPPEKIAQTLQCSLEELTAAREYLATLNPFPGRKFTDEPPLEPPEITAVKGKNGTWIAQCNAEDLPLFRVDEETLANAKEKVINKEERERVTKWEEQARLWVEAYNERNATLREVAQRIFNRQTDFLDSAGDPATLKPLLQREIAEALGYDESTISRAIKDKIVRIGHTTKYLPLKDFFTHALKAPTGENADAVSDQQAKSALKALIAAEDRAHPLSDQALVEALAQQNIVLARRTVAKYREQLGILSTRERRCKL